MVHLIMNSTVFLGSSKQPLTLKISIYIFRKKWFSMTASILENEYPL